MDTVTTAQGTRIEPRTDAKHSDARMRGQSGMPASFCKHSKAHASKHAHSEARKDNLVLERAREHRDGTDAGLFPGRGANNTLCMGVRAAVKGLGSVPLRRVLAPRLQGLAVHIPDVDHGHREGGRCSSHAFQA
mmetsp:Transcript_13093/g.19706  ORF Transcript_13093/g.19706 Transcript_13093/m.19706 type:complete len:134 (+) Transcript_13093:154-555(+)